MRHRPQRRVPVWLALGLLISGAMPSGAADPEIDRLLQSPVARDWVTNGGNLTNLRSCLCGQALGRTGISKSREGRVRREIAETDNEVEAFSTDRWEATVPGLEATFGKVRET